MHPPSGRNRAFFWLAARRLPRYGRGHCPPERLATLMTYTLGTAARALGKSKSALSRDIKIGRLSAIKNANGSYTIDPAELHRVYPPVSPEPDKNVKDGLLLTGDGDRLNRALNAELHGLREQLDLLKGERDDLRRRLDAESEERRRLTYLLTDARTPPPAVSGWWARLFR